MTALQLEEARVEAEIIAMSQAGESIYAVSAWLTKQLAETRLELRQTRLRLRSVA